MENRNYYYKGNKYIVLSSSAKMKDVNTGEWHEAVLYQNHREQTDIYVREKKSFLEKFFPDRLKKGDLIAFIYHGKLLGVTEVLKTDETIATVPKCILTSIRYVNVNVDENGYVGTIGDVDIYFNNQDVLKTKITE